MTINIDIVTVATNIYIDYWKNLASSIDESIAKGSEKKYRIKLHIFTDQSEIARVFSNELRKIEVCTHTIDSYRWPEATLLRYQIFNADKEEFTGEVLMHLDADMIVQDNIWDDVYASALPNQMVLVRHPGYWPTRRNLSKSVLRFLPRGIQRRLSINGSWEVRKISTAYVPIQDRKKYFCGGTWWGERGAFLEFINEMAVNVRVDLSRDVVATWHDESHLNAWASRNTFTEMTPSFCYVHEYSRLSSLKPRIVAVTKDLKTRD